VISHSSFYLSVIAFAHTALDQAQRADGSILSRTARKSRNDSSN